MVSTISPTAWFLSIYGAICRCCALYVTQQPPSSKLSTLNYQLSTIDNQQVVLWPSSCNWEIGRKVLFPTCQADRSRATDRIASWRLSREADRDAHWSHRRWQWNCCAISRLISSCLTTHILSPELTPKRIALYTNFYTLGPSSVRRDWPALNVFGYFLLSIALLVFSFRKWLRLPACLPVLSTYYQLAKAHLFRAELRGRANWLMDLVGAGHIQRASESNRAKRSRRGGRWCRSRYRRQRDRETKLLWKIIFLPLPNSWSGSAWFCIVS